MRESHTDPSTFIVQGGRVVDPAQHLDRTGDVLVTDGRIAALDPNARAPGTPVVDARGLIVCPGLIDIHVHLREPGAEHKETIETGTRAAAAGGFTAVACMPNTKPAIDTVETLTLIIERARAVGSCRVYPVATITARREGIELADVAALRRHGAIAFSDDGDGVENDDLMRAAFQQAKDLDVVLIQHCEYKSISAGGVMHKGAVSDRLGLPGLDRASEDRMIERDIALMRETGARYHVAHISTAGAVQLVRDAKAEGLPITTEVCPHHLLLTDEACTERDPNTKMHPPLRSAADVDACKAGLVDGTIDCIVTDHAPHAADEKAKGFLAAPPGIVGIESSLALVLKAFPDASPMGWLGLIHRMTVAPAEVLGLEVPTLSPGRPADLTLIDPHAKWRIDPVAFHSKSRNTPFSGWGVVGRPVATFLGGRLSHCLDSEDRRLEWRKAAIN